MPIAEWHAVIKRLALPHMEAIKAEEPERRKRAQRGEVVVKPTEELARRVGEDLKAMGITRSIAGTTIENIVRYGTTNFRKKSRAIKRAQRDPRVTSANKSMKATRRSDELNQHRSMLNAPPNKLNLPLIRRAEQVQRLLVELSAVDPEVAVTQIPVERCRQWLSEDAAWWSRFIELCEQRWRKETPEVPLMRYPRKAKLASAVSSATEDYRLSPLQSSVLAWLREQTEPRLVSDIAEAIGSNSERGSVLAILIRLRQLDLVRETTGLASSRMYEVVRVERWCV